MVSKRYKNILKIIESSKNYELSDAIEILRNNNFEKSKNLELSFSLNWNTKQGNIRDFVVLPYPVEREGKIAIIDENVPIELKSDENIVFINLEELSKVTSKKKKSTWGFDKLFAHSTILEKLKPFAKKLSLKKLFPNLKDGTLTDDLEKSITEWRKGRIELKSDRGGNFHTILGKSSFEKFQLESNYKVIFTKILSLKPNNWKGDYLKNITLSTTMGPGIKISI